MPNSEATPRPDSEDDPVLNAKCCFWFGKPPCPKCGGDHGDPDCTDKNDNELRTLILDQRERDALLAVAKAAEALIHCITENEVARWSELDAALAALRETEQAG